MRLELFQVLSAAKYVFADKLVSMMSAYLKVVKLIGTMRASVGMLEEMIALFALASMQMILRRVLMETVEGLSRMEKS